MGAGTISHGDSVRSLRLFVYYNKKIFPPRPLYIIYITRAYISLCVRVEQTVF